jgi:RLL motif containing protein 1
MSGLNSPLRQAAKALGYEHWDLLLTEDSLPFRKFISFIENTKIRLNKIGERPVTKLNSKSWNQDFKTYLTNLQCPYQIETQRNAAIFWLVSHALSFDYEDGKKIYDDQIAIKATGSNTNKNIKTVPTEGSSSDIFEEKINDALHSVGINNIEIENKTLLEKSQLLERVVRRKFSTRAVRDAKNKKKNNNNGNSMEEVLNVDDFPLGFSTGSVSLDKAATVLKMLYIAELRDIQRGVNQVLTTAQEYTGDPKTDSSLGRVGR